MTIVVSSFRKKATRTAWKSTFDRNKLKFNFRSQIVCYYQEPWISFIISNCHVNSIKCHMLKSCQKPRPLKKLGDNDRHTLVFFSSKMSVALAFKFIAGFYSKAAQSYHFFHDQLKVENVEMSTKRAKCSHLLFNSPLQRYVFKIQSKDDNHRSVKWLMFIVNKKILNVSFCLLNCSNVGWLVVLRWCCHQSSKSKPKIFPIDASSLIHHK